MFSISWPNMFNSNQQTTKILSNKEAIQTTLRLLLNTEKGELFGDPYFGVRLKRIKFEQNTDLLTDLIVDELYTAIIEFLPQITVSRNDIHVVRGKGTEIAIEMYVTYNFDNTTDLYTIQLMNNIQEG